MKTGGLGLTGVRPEGVFKEKGQTKGFYPYDPENPALDGNGWPAKAGQPSRCVSTTDSKRRRRRSRRSEGPCSRGLGSSLDRTSTRACLLNADAVVEDDGSKDEAGHRRPGDDGGRLVRNTERGMEVLGEVIG